jgi:hypothetical protein
MKLRGTFIEGSTKTIVKASPVQILLFRKKYLKSLSPGRLISPIASPISSPANIRLNLPTFVLKSPAKKRLTQGRISDKVSIKAKFLADKYIYERLENKNRVKLNSL